MTSEIARIRFCFSEERLNSVYSSVGFDPAVKIFLEHQSEIETFVVQQQANELVLNAKVGSLSVQTVNQLVESFACYQKAHEQFLKATCDLYSNYLVVMDDQLRKKQTLAQLELEDAKQSAMDLAQTVGITIELLGN